MNASNSIQPRAFGVAIVFGLLPLGLRAQGSLTPPGAPAPVMKSLDQIEARIPVDATHTPGDGNNIFIITNSGSYYLTTNVFATAARNGIKIDADGVTLDLNGFELNGNGVGFNGVFIVPAPPRRQNPSIRNGSIRNWKLSGVDLGFGINALFERLRVYGNGGTGIIAPENSVVRDCLAFTNANAGPGFASGIATGSGALIVNCVAAANGNNSTNCFGILSGSSSTISHCTANQNNAPNGGGINAGLDSIVVDCAAGLNSGANGVGIRVASGSSIIHCAVSGNSGSGGVGILASQRARIEGCTVSDNGGDGIRATNDCSIVANTCANNGAAGIHTTGVANRIDSNHVIENSGNGIKVDGLASLVVRNSARGSGANNFTIVAGNNDAARLGGGSNFTGADPWANFSY